MTGLQRLGRIWPFLKLPGAKVTCTSGVADSSNTLTEAATIDGLQVSMPLPVTSQRTTPAKGRPRERLLAVWARSTG
jgi:hypothetical protein